VGEKDSPVSAIGDGWGGLVEIVIRYPAISINGGDGSRSQISSTSRTVLQRETHGMMESLRAFSAALKKVSR
jgi:cyclopropane fatty-acyl-phospholipid synthase-like methyltransferase